MAISNASNQIVKVNLIPGIIPSVLHLSQYDTGAGRPITFSVYDGSQAFTIPSGVSIAFEGTKPDGNGFSFTCSKSGNNALLTNYTNQMTALSGKIMCQLVFTNASGGRVGSLPVLMVVTPAGINGNTVISDSDIEAIIAAQNQYAVLNAKLDTAISAVTQDSEVQDIRVKADGTTAATAGDAVREQITELKNDIKQTATNDNGISNLIGAMTGTVQIYSVFSQGGFQASGMVESTSQIRSLVIPSGQYTFTPKNGASFQIFYYLDDAHGTAFSYFRDTAATFTLANNFVITLKKSDNSAVSPNEWNNLISITQTKEVTQDFVVKINNLTSRASQNGTNLDTITDFGWYMVYSAVNAPTEYGTDIVYLEVLNFTNNNGDTNTCVVQNAYYARGGLPSYMRSRLNNGAWSAWTKTAVTPATKSVLTSFDLDTKTDEGSYITTAFTNGPVETQTAIVRNSVLATNWTLQELILFGHQGARYYRINRGSGSYGTWINTSGYPVYSCVNFGDSIYGNNRGADSISYKFYCLSGWKTFNAGCGGCRMSATASDNYLYFSMVKLVDAIASGTWTDQDTAAAAIGSYYATTIAGLKAIDFDEVNRITISYGTNDWAANVAIGSDDVTDETITTFKGALRYTIHKFSATFPQAKISICGLFNRFQVSGGSVIADGTTWQNSNEKTPLDFANAAKEVAEQCGIQYIDQFYLSFNKYNYETFFLDDTHLNDAGCEIAAMNLYKKIV